MLDWGGDGGGDCGGDCGGDVGGDCGVSDMQMTIVDCNYPVKTSYTCVLDPPTGNMDVQGFNAFEEIFLQPTNSNFYYLNTPNYLLAGVHDWNKTNKFQRRSNSSWSCLELFLLLVVLCMMLLTIVWIVKTVLAYQY